MHSLPDQNKLALDAFLHVIERQQEQIDALTSAVAHLLPQRNSEDNSRISLLVTQASGTRRAIEKLRNDLLISES